MPSSSSLPLPLFDLSPPILHFSSSTPHLPQTLLLTITNRSPTPQFFHLTPPSSHLFTVQQRPTPSSKLATGMSVLVDVTFTPSHPLSLDDRLLITGGPDPSTPPQTVPLLCRVGAARVTVRGGEAGTRGVVGGSSAIPLLVTNDSPFDVLVSVASSDPAFHLPLPHLSLPPSHTHQLIVHYRPSQPGPSLTTLSLHLSRPSTSDSAATLTHPLSAHCDDLSGLVTLSSTHLRLPPTFMSLTSQSSLTLTNASPHPIAWALTPPPSPGPFDVLPRCGELYPQGTCDLTVTFTPRGSQGYAEQWRLSATGVVDGLGLSLEGLGVGPSLSFQPSSHLDLGVLDMDRPVAFTVTLENDGMIEAGWTYTGESLGRGGEGRGEWAVDVGGGRLGVRREVRERQRRERRTIRLLRGQHDEGEEEEDEGEADEDESVHPPSRAQVTFTFTPRHVGALLAQLPFDILHSSQLLLTVKASVVGPVLVPSARRLELGDVGVGVRHEQQLTLRNDSAIHARLHARVRPGNDDVLLRVDAAEASAVDFAVAAGATVSVIVIYAPAAAGELKAEVEVDVEGVGEGLYVIPVVATAVVPPFRLSASSIALSPTFIHHTSSGDVRVVNDNAIAMRVNVAVADDSDDDVVLSASTLLLPAHSSAAVTVAVTPRSLEPRAVSVAFTSRGAASSTALPVSFAASGPLVTLSSSSLTFPAHACLSSSSLPVTLTNASPIPAAISPFFHTRYSPFTVDHPTAFTLPPHSSLELTVTSTPVEPASSITGSLSFLVTHADPLTLSLTSSAFGSSIHPSLPFHPLLPTHTSLPAETPSHSFGHQPTMTPLAAPFHLHNRSTRRHRLVWTHVPRLPLATVLAMRKTGRGATASTLLTPADHRKMEWDAVVRDRRAGVPATVVTVFRVEPAEVVLDGLKGVECRLVGLGKAEGEVTERWVCEAHVDGERGAVVVFDTSVHAHLVTPAVVFATAALAFDHCVDPADPSADEASVRLERVVTLTNPTRIPLAFTLSAPHPFSLSSNSGRLGPGDCHPLTVAYQPALSSFHRRTTSTDERLTVRFTGHTREQSVALHATVHFANVVVPEAVEFGCGVGDVNRRVVRAVRNEGVLPVRYRWRFAGAAQCTSEERGREGEEGEDRRRREDDEAALFARATATGLFDVTPIEGFIPPGGDVPLEVIFHAPHAPSPWSSLRFATTVQCAVEGGPTYPVRLSASVSSLSYGLSHRALEFGTHALSTSATLSLTVHNCGTLPFPLLYHCDSPLFTVHPASHAVLEADERLKLRVTFHARYLAGASATLLLTIAHLPPIPVSLTATGAYPALHVSLPHHYPDQAHARAYAELLDGGVGEEEAQAAVYDRWLHGSMSDAPLVTEYVVDFPPSAVGDVHSRSFTVTNRSPFPSPLSFDANLLSHSVFSLTSSSTAHILPAGESVTLTWTSHGHVQSKSKKPSTAPAAGEHSLRVPLLVHPTCPPVVLVARATVYVPALRLSSATLAMPLTRVGQVSHGYLQLTNDQPVPCDWHITPPSLAGGKGDGGVRVHPDSGTLAGGERMNVGVVLEPREAQAGRVKASLRVKGGVTTAIVISTEAWMPSFTVTPSSLTLPPLLPHSSSVPVELTLQNPSHHPVEVFSPLFDAAQSAQLALLSGLTAAPALLIDPLPVPAPTSLPALIAQRLREQRDGFTSSLPHHLGCEVLSASSLPMASLSPIVVNLIVVAAPGDARAFDLWSGLGQSDDALVDGWDDVVGWYRGMADERVKEDDRVRREEDERDRRLRELQKRREKAKGKKDEEDRIAQEEDDERARTIAPVLAYTPTQLALASSLPPSPSPIPSSVLAELLQTFLTRERYAKGFCWTTLWSAAVGVEEGVRLLMDVMGQLGAVRENRLYVAVLDERREDWHRRMAEAERALTAKAQEDSADKGKKKSSSAEPALDEERERALRSLASDRARGEEYFALDVAAMFGCPGVPAVWTLDMSEEEKAWREAERERQADEDRRREEERKRVEEARLLAPSKPGKKQSIAAPATPSARSAAPSPKAEQSAPVPPVVAAAVGAPPLLTSSPASASSFAFVKLRRFDTSSTDARLQSALTAFVKEEPFSLFPSPSLPSFHPTTSPLPLPAPATYDLIRLRDPVPSYALPPSSSLSLRPSGRWLLPPQSSVSVWLTHSSTSSLGIFSLTVPFQCTQSAAPVLVPLSTVVTVPTLTVEMVKEKGTRGVRVKGGKRWSRSAGRFEFGKLLVGGGRREADGEGADAGRDTQVLGLTNTSPFDVRVELCMKDDTTSVVDEPDASAAAVDKRKAAAKLTSPRGGKEKKAVKAVEDEGAEEERRAALLRPVFSTSVTAAVIPVGGTIQVRLFAHPQSLASFADTLVIAIEDNPIPVLLPLHCTAIAPVLSVRPASVAMPRLLVGAMGKAAFTVVNASPIALGYQLQWEGADWLTLTDRVGEVKGGEERVIPFSITSPTPADLSAELTLLTLDSASKPIAEPIKLTVSGTVYHCDAALDPSSEAVDFGCVRVRGTGEGEGDAKDVVVENRGKAELRYEVDVSATSVLHGRVSVVGGAKGVIPPKGTAAIGLKLRVSEATQVTGCRDLRVLVRERDEDEPVALPVTVSFTSAHPSYRLVQGEAVSFPALRVREEAVREVRLVNDGRFDLHWAVYDGAEGSEQSKAAVHDRRLREREHSAEEQRLKDEAAAADAAAATKKAKDKAPAKSKGKATPEAALGAAPLVSSLSLSPFTITPSSGVLLPGAEVVIAVRVQATEPGRFTHVVELDVEGVVNLKAKAVQQQLRREREERRRKPWLSLTPPPPAVPLDRGELIPLSAVVEAAQVSAEWSAVFAGQTLRDRRRREDDKVEEAEFLVDEATLVFGCARVVGEGSAEERKDDKAKAAKGKEKKPEAVAAPPSERREVRTETIRLINSGNVEARVFVSLTPTPLPSPAAPWTLPSSRRAASPVAGKKDKAAAVAAAPPSVPTAAPVTLGPFTAQSSTLTLPPHSTTPYSLSFAPSAPGASTAAFNLFTLHSTSSLHFTLAGYATAVALSASPSSLEFERVRVGDRRALHVTVKNPSLLPLRARCAVSVGAGFACEFDGKEVVVPAAGSLAVPVTFAPSAASAVTGELTLKADLAEVSVPMTATGFSQAVLVTDGAVPARVDGVAGLVPVVDLGDVLTGQRGSGAFRLHNTSTDVQRFTIAGLSSATAAAPVKGKTDAKPVPAEAEGATDWSFSPAVGHLLPGASKLIKVTVKADITRQWKGVKVALDVQRVKRTEADAVNDWDDEVRVVRWLSVDEQLRRREVDEKDRQDRERAAAQAQEEADAKAKKGKPATKTPRAAPTTTSADPKDLPPIAGPVEVTSVVPEPAFTVVEEKAAVPLYVSAVVDRPRLSLSASSVAFGDVLMYQQRTERVTVVNGSAVSAPFQWVMDGAASFTVSPSQGVVPPQGSLSVTVNFAPVTDAVHSATATLYSTPSSPLLLGLIAKSTRPVYHLQLPAEGEDAGDVELPAGLDKSEVRVVRVDSVGVNARTLTRVFVLNTGGREWPFQWRCEDPAVEARVQEDPERLTLPPLSSAPAQSLASSSQPFTCLTAAGSIAAGKREEMTFAFAPSSAAGPAEVTSLWAFSAAGVTVHVLLIGRVLEPEVTVAPSILAFHHALLSHTKALPFTLTNRSAIPLTFFTTVLPAPSSALTLHPPKGVIGSGETATVVAEFRPAEVRGYEWRVVVGFVRKRERLYVRVGGEGYSLRTKVVGGGDVEVGEVGKRKGRGVGRGVAGKAEESKEQIQGEDVAVGRGRKLIKKID